MLVVKQSRHTEFLTKAYSDVTDNAYRSAATFYEKIAARTIGISRRDVEEFLKKVELKQISLPPKKAIIKPILARLPLDQFEMDLVDMSEYKNWNKGVHFLLNVIDVHTKYAWSRPLKNKSGPLVASEMQNIILLFGGPKVISSDNGTEFNNVHMDALAKRWSIEMRHSLPYTPKTSGQIERFNASLKSALQKWMQDYDTKSYLAALPFVLYAYNTSRHSAAKYTPYQAMFKRDERNSAFFDPTFDKTKGDLMDQKVYDNEVKAAERMIEQNMKKHPLDPLALTSSGLEVGDRVRISLWATKEGRKRALNKIASRNKTKVNWTREVYTVAAKRDNRSMSKDGKDTDKQQEDKVFKTMTEMYLLEDDDGLLVQDDEKVERKSSSDRGDTGRWFYRYQLQKVVDDEVKAKSKKDKPDLNFGRFDLESHLLTAAAKAIEGAAIPEAELEKGEEEKDDAAIDEAKRDEDNEIKFGDDGEAVLPEPREPEKDREAKDDDEMDEKHVEPAKAPEPKAKAKKKAAPKSKAKEKAAPLLRTERTSKRKNRGANRHRVVVE